MMTANRSFYSYFFSFTYFEGKACFGLAEEVGV